MMCEDVSQDWSNVSRCQEQAPAIIYATTVTLSDTETTVKEKIYEVMLVGML